MQQKIVDFHQVDGELQPCVEAVRQLHNDFLGFHEMVVGACNVFALRKAYFGKPQIFYT
jgi:hypothetical protein